MLDLWDWVVEGWNSLDFSNWFSGLDFGEIDTLIDSVDSGFESLGNAITNVASSVLEGSVGGGGVSPLVESAVNAGGSTASEFFGSAAVDIDPMEMLLGDKSGVTNMITGITKSEGSIASFWDSLGSKERAAILQAGLSGIAGGAAAYLQGKQAKDLMKDRTEADKELVHAKGEEDRATLDHRQQMNKVPTRRPFTAAPGAPQIRRPSGQPVYGLQDELGLIKGAM